MPRIAYGQADVWSWLKFQMGEGALCGKVHSVQADFQQPPGLAHGMRGICAEIHEYLLHLGRVSQHSTGMEVYLLAESNRGWEHCAQQLQHFLDEEVQLERLALRLCLAAKCEHLLHQVPSALSSHEDLLQVIPGDALPRHIVQRKLCIPQHGSQDIVEVVGNTPYQGPQCLHFLRLAQLGFELETFGNVTDYDNEPLNTPVNGKSRRGDLDVDRLSIFADYLPLQVGCSSGSSQEFAAAPQDYGRSGGRVQHGRGHP